MIRVYLLAVFLILSFVSPAHSSRVCLSFFGYDYFPLDSFDEAVDSTVTFYLPGTFGPSFQGSQHYFGLRSANHEFLGFDLPDTQSDPGCAGYDLTVWFEPGSVPIGHVTGLDQNAFLEGSEWLDHQPTDFTHLRIEFQAGYPCLDDIKQFMIPIEWITSPVPTQNKSWGQLKNMY